MADILNMNPNAKSYPSSTLHEAAGKIGNLPSSIQAVAAGMKLWGPAFTVFSPSRDNLWLHRAIYAAQPGDILMVSTGGEAEAGYWGEIMTHAALSRRIGGLVLDGSVRDTELLAGLPFPVFCSGRCIRGTTKNKEAFGGLQISIRIGETAIHPGDLVAGDADGVVVIPKNRVAETLKLSEQREQQEARYIKEIQSGKSTLTIYDLS